MHAIVYMLFFCLAYVVLGRTVIWLNKKVVVFVNPGSIVEDIDWPLGIADGMTDFHHGSFGIQVLGLCGWITLPLWVLATWIATWVLRQGCEIYDRFYARIDTKRKRQSVNP